MGVAILAFLAGWSFRDGAASLLGLGVLLGAKITAVLVGSRLFRRRALAPGGRMRDSRLPAPRRPDMWAARDLPRRRAVRVAFAAVAVTLGALVTAPAASATVDLTATGVRIGEHPAFVRVVVDFTDGTLILGEVEATDPTPADGTVRVRLSHRRVQDQAAAESRFGVHVASRQGRNRILLKLTMASRRLKYVQISVQHGPERLVLDLYRSRPPRPGAAIPAAPDGCLELESVRTAANGFRVRGREHQLFEHSFVLQIRNARGRVVGMRIMTAIGRWSARVRYDVGRPQAGTLEATADSAKDGSLDCLAQMRVRLRR